MCVAFDGEKEDTEVLLWDTKVRKDDIWSPCPCSGDRRPGVLESHCRQMGFAEMLGTGRVPSFPVSMVDFNQPSIMPELLVWKLEDKEELILRVHVVMRSTVQ